MTRDDLYAMEAERRRIEAIELAAARDLMEPLDLPEKDAHRPTPAQVGHPNGQEPGGGS